MKREEGLAVRSGASRMGNVRTDGAEEPTSLCRLPARSPGCSWHGGHKPGIEHQGGHFYGRQLCLGYGLATLWVVVSLQYSPLGWGREERWKGGRKKKRARTRHRGTTRDTRRNTAVHRRRVDAGRKKELVTFPRFTTGWIAPIDHPLPFFFFLLLLSSTFRERAPPS